jgi:amidohydrolase
MTLYARFAAVLALIVSAGVASPGAQELAVPAAVRAQVDAAAAAMQPAMVERRRDLHRHPELGFRETRTSALVAERLRALGFDEVRTGVGVTGVVGVLKGGRPGRRIAIRADMDALPIPELIDVPYKSTVANVKHACGHDAHVTIALGVAEIFSKLRAQLPGTVVFFFQPAEEGDPDGGRTGALRMLDDGLFQTPPEMVFGLHVMPTIEAGQIGVNVGGAMAASDRFTVTITGKKTHGAYPHTGIDPVPIAAQAVMAFQTIVSRQRNAADPTVLSVGAISGGNRYNIIADAVKMEGTVRTLSKDGPSFVREHMDAILKGLTSGYGASYTLDYKEGAPVTWNDPALTAASRPALESIVGKANVITPAPQMGAEDFAYYQARVPGLFFFLGVANAKKNITAMIHTEYFDLDEDALPIGVRALSTVALDALFRSAGAK